MDNVQVFLESFTPVYLRCVGVLALLPLGEGIRSVLRKGLLAAGMACLMAGRVPSAPAWSLFGAAAELFIGVMVSLPCALVVSICAMSGELMDAGRGQTISNMYDPLTGGSKSHMGIFLQSLSWVYLLMLGILEKLLVGVSESFQVVGAGAFDAADLKALGQGYLSCALPLLAGMFTAFLPFAVLFMLVNFAAGFLTKVMPQLQVYSETFQLKTYLGLLLLAVLLRFEPAVVLERLALPALHLIPG